MKFTGERFIPEEVDVNDEMYYEHLNRYVSLEDQVSGKIVLDAACGVGYGTHILANSATKVYGIDIDKESISYAQKKYVSDNITFEVASVTKLPYEDNYFDVIVSFEIIEHLNKKEQEKFLSEIKRVLKEDGSLIISTPDKTEYSEKEEYINHFHIHEFYNFLKSKFNYVHFLYQRNEICNIISDSLCDEVKIIRKDDIDSTKGKYVIAICSNVELQNQKCASVQIQTGEFNYRIQRILDLQDEIEEKNQWALSLDKEVNRLQTVLNEECDKIKYLELKKEQLAQEFSGKLQNAENLNAEQSRQIEEQTQALQKLQTRLSTVESQKNKTEEELNNQKYTNTKQEKIIKNVNKKAEENFITSKNIEAFQHIHLKHQTRLINTLLSNKSKNPFKQMKNLEKFQHEFKELERKFNRIPRVFLEKFDASSYLIANEDVALAIEKGDFDNALEHFVFFGFEEVKSGLRKLNNSLSFYSENEYLNAHNDVKLAVEAKQFQDGFEHYLTFGCFELLNGSRYQIEANPSDKLDLKIVDPESMNVSYANTIKVPKFENPLVSLIIPAYNQANYTLACIQSIVQNTSTIPYEIILMDDKSPEEDARNLKYFVEGITFISNEENLGFLRNCNKGADLAKGKYILFLNNDTNVQPNWLNSLVELIESDESIGMVGSRLVYPDGRQQEAGGIIWNDASGWNFGRLDDPMKPEYNYVKEVDYISGAAIMIRKSLWTEIGGFDERYVPAYYEDTDLAFEVRAHGYKVMYQPKSIVIHFEGVSNGTDLGSGIKKYQVVNNQKFLEKWKKVLESEHFPNAQDVFLARDRSEKKPHVLFVDHYLPHYDQDAGSKAAYQYLQILTKSNMQVHFIGDNFWHYPDTSYLDVVTKLGIEVLYGNWYAENWKEWLRENGKYLDYIILSRPHISVKYIDFVREYTHAKIIYFGHDLHFLREQREYEIKDDLEYLESAKRWQIQELELMRKSDIAYFFSDVEKNVIKQTDSSINVDVVPLFIYDKFEYKQYVPKQRQNIMFVGGFGHSPNVDAVEWFVKDIFPIVQQTIHDIHFYIIGSNPPQEIENLGSEYITITGFISDEELEKYYSKCKIVVAPLRYGAGVKGKIIDALHRGMPVVTTTIGAEGIQDAINILKIADDSKKFATEIINLYMNDEALIKLSEKSFENSKEFFSETYATKQMSNIIKEIGVNK